MAGPNGGQMATDLSVLNMTIADAEAALGNDLGSLNVVSAELCRGSEQLPRRPKWALGAFRQLERARSSSGRVLAGSRRRSCRPSVPATSHRTCCAALRCRLPAPAGGCAQGAVGKHRDGHHALLPARALLAAAARRAAAGAAARTQEAQRAAKGARRGRRGRRGGVGGRGRGRATGTAAGGAGGAGRPAAARLAAPWD